MKKTPEPTEDDSNSSKTDEKKVDRLTREERELRARVATFSASNRISLDELYDRHASDSRRPKRLGFLRGHVQVPDDFNSVGSEEIDQLFGKEP